ncbi:MAG: hypothetical protein ACRDNL_00370 [Spirillospora sp.]
MLFTVMALNFQYGGRRDADGRPDDRWPDLVGIVSKEKPDLLLGQEAHGWGGFPRLQAAAEDALGMRAHVAPSPSGAHTVVMHRTDTLQWRRWETRYARETLNGFGVGVLDLIADPKVKVPLTAIPVHLNPYSVQRAATEAQLLIGRLYRYGGMGLMGGDINHPAPGDPEPDWDSVPPYNRSSRCHRRSHPDEPWRGNTLVGQTLRDADLVDAAAHMAAHTEDTGLLAPTARHGGIRTDQIWVTDNMTDAVADYRRIPTGQASDHDAILVTIDTAALRQVQARPWT